MNITSIDTNTDTQLASNLSSTPQIDEPNTDGSSMPPLHDSRGKFATGHIGLGGRPKKGTRYVDKLKQERDSNADKLAKHHVTMALVEDRPRWAVYLRDTLDGTPVKRVELMGNEAPWLSWLNEAESSQQLEALMAGNAGADGHLDAEWREVDE